MVSWPAGDGELRFSASPALAIPSLEPDRAVSAEAVGAVSAGERGGGRGGG